MNADRAICDFFWRVGVSQIDAGIYGVWILIGHLPERILYDARGVASYTQFEKQDAEPLVAPYKVLISLSGAVPAGVFHKGIVCSEIHGHRFAAYRASGDQFRRDSHIFLRFHHFPDGSFVVIGLFMAGSGALPKAVVPLSVKQPVFIKTGFLETVVYIGGKDKVVFVLNQAQKIGVDGLRGILIAVDIDISTPIGPVFFQGFVGIEAGGIHILETIDFYKVLKVFLKATAGID